MSFLTRWDDDHSRPKFTSALRDVFVRAVLPAVAIFLAIVGFGLLLEGPLLGLDKAEDGVSTWFEDQRTATYNTITNFMSMVGNTEYVIGVGVIVCAIVWWRTKEWWFAVVPMIAISLQATVFVIAAAVVSRDRPPVERLDPTPPTSSYPSGHVGASTALYVSFALMATRISNVVVRRVVITLCILAPLLVSFARLYRGAHHISDIVVGILNGLLCALLAWNYLRRDPAGSSSTDAGVSGENESVQTRA
jgi:membrane-associated phospholipid phosphatase